jgi:hypothetical protein
MCTSALESKGFFAALFDFGFTSFITLKFLRVIYALLVGTVLLIGLICLVAGLSSGGIVALFALILAPLVTLLYLIFIRIAMEVIALFFRIGEATNTMAAASASQIPLQHQPTGVPSGVSPQG